MNRISNKYRIERASVDDLDQILNIYFSIYGNRYPLRLGIDRNESLKAIQDHENYYWYVSKDRETVDIAGCSIFEIDHRYRIGKVSGVVTNRNYRKQGIASHLIEYGKRKLLEEDQLIHSLYTTTRTVSVAPQLMFLKNGFKPLGIFPNAHKIIYHETLTLLGAYRSDVLQKRSGVRKIPEQLAPILKVIEEHIKSNGNITPPRAVKRENYHPWQSQPSPSEVDFYEFIAAPHYVFNRFSERFKDDLESGFCPFHKPNLMIVSKIDNSEVYAYHNKKDDYCALIASSCRLSEMKGDLKDLILAMKSYGIAYLEALVGLDQFEGIFLLLDNEFLPSAIYPAMREEDGRMKDYIFLTRTMEPLDYRGMNIHQSFHPYINQYTKQWVDMHFDTLKVYND